MDHDDHDPTALDGRPADPASPDGKNDYKIGFRRPPRHTQFQPGVSGNPKGRPRQPRTVGQMLRETVSRPITITENGRRRTVTWLEALLLQIGRAALQGDAKATDRMIRLLPAVQAAFAEVGAGAGGAAGKRADAQASGAPSAKPSAFDNRTDRELLAFFADQIQRGELSFGDVPGGASLASGKDRS